MDLSKITNKTIPERYKRNIPAISGNMQELLAESTVAVAGCGGLGGYIIEYLARAGVGKLILIDGDRFDGSNLNRQILCTENAVKSGENKADAAEKRVREINSDVAVKAFCAFLCRENAEELLKGADLAIDALDSVSSRLILEYACEKSDIPIVHGAVTGWNLQVAVCEPGSRVISRLYGSVTTPGEHTAKDGQAAYAEQMHKTCLAFTPAMCASIQAAEAIKILAGQKSELRDRLLMADLKYLDFDIADLF